MGKKLKEPDAIKSLFSDSNPFRRKPEPEPKPKPQSPPPPPAELGLESSPFANAKKRKRDKKLEENSEHPKPISSTPESISKKRKKVENGEDVSEDLKKSTKKRKRDEIEAQYEKRKYGEIAETEEVAVVNVGEKRKAKDVVASESKGEDEGFDDESKLLRTVFVGNLPVKIKKKVLMKEFEKFGEIESVRIRSVPLVDSKTPRKGAIIKGKLNEAVGRVNAYIVFNNEQSAQAALSNNMTVIGENHIRVDMACPPRKKLKAETQLYERKKTVFVGNLPFDVKDEELYQLFCGSNPSESSVEAVRVVRDPQTSLGKGIAYVLFKTRDAANQVCKRGDLMIRDRTLRVCHAKADATPTKRKDAGPKRDFPRKKFAVSCNERSSEKNENAKPSAASLSYQGLRASKSGVVKKSGLHSRPSSGHGNHGSKRERGFDKQDSSKGKRPAVAARKAKMLMKKRKLESGTPESTHRNKKVRKH
ncbi:uncharacterized protein A4U43_C04F11800 [Asparagus officinalis]|uniref:RRM domain-containing protein n=1 Tax=Asparagus officinalis TaxID=4686 RepID=A0A5P1F1Y8_ASPOF|nr:RNA-binding protein 34 [Asparagus officinalis]ONK71733.1 uncharacterized protein A4U43_C04F11800 [Asparagus officinalis]